VFVVLHLKGVETPTQYVLPKDQIGSGMQLVSKREIETQQIEEETCPPHAISHFLFGPILLSIKTPASTTAFPFLRKSKSKANLHTDIHFINT